MTETLIIQPKTVYTNLIQYKTNVQDGYNGYEQCVGLRIHPVKRFTLEYALDPTNAAAFVTFFNSMAGQYAEFYWSPEIKCTGQVSKTYTARFVSDSLQIKSKKKGYVQFSIDIHAIDNSPLSGGSVYSDLSSFEHIDVYETSLIYRTIISDNITANMSVIKAWDNPKRQWSLKYRLNPEDLIKFEDFFCTQKGKLKKFNFTWLESLNGDGATYNVRFDTDELEITNDWKGYGALAVPIIQVFE